MKIEEIYDLIEEEMEKGIDKSEMTLHMTPESIEQLREESNLPPAPGKRNVDVDRVAGIDIVTSFEDKISVETVCGLCESDKIYHDSREKWVCPFCDDI